MKLFLLSCICLVSLIVVSAQIADLPQDLRNGFFPRRSADIILKNNDLNDLSKAATMMFDTSGSNKYITNQAASPMSVYNVADVICRSLGVQPLNADYTPEFVNSNMFDRPGANLLVSMAIGDEDITKYGLSNLANLRANSPVSARMSVPQYPQSSLATAASVATGTTPSQHGIVADAWKYNGETVRAFSDASAQVANVADVLLQSFEGRPLALSISADARHANAHSANPALMEANPNWNSFSVANNAQSFGVADASSVNAQRSGIENALTVPLSTLKSVLASENGILSLLAQTDVSAKLENDVVTLTFPASAVSQLERTATFNLNEPADLSLFSELQYVHTLPTVLRNTPELSTLTADGVPDLYTMSLGSLKMVRDSYGEASAQYAGALKLTDSVLPQIIDRLASIYPQRAVAQVVLLGQESAPDSKVVSALSAQFPKLADAAMFFPQLYLSEGETDEVCASASLQLDIETYQVYCAGSTRVPTPRSFLETEAATTLQATASDSGSGTASETFPDQSLRAEYQIWLWVTIGMTFAVFFAAYAIANMDFKRDTLLYSSFNPKWEGSS